MKKLIIIIAIMGLGIHMIPSFAQSQNVPVIILFKEKVGNEEINLVKLNNGEITQVFHIINGVAAKIPSEQIVALKNDPRIMSIDSDIEVHSLDLDADKQIEADKVWHAGDIGGDVPVAILDTGIDTSHPEFIGRIAKCHSEVLKKNTCEDQSGHGTHVAGIVASAGIVNMQSKGVSPAASLYVDQVLDSSGSGSLSKIIAGIDWAADNGAKIISMSLGTNPISTTESNCDTSFHSLAKAINNAVSDGITVIAAAGNDGFLGVDAPACISNTIAVGAVDNTDTIAPFSSIGSPMTDHGIMAPGVNIRSTWLGDGYLTLNGTSMATPMVTGTVALILKANPVLSPADIKNILFSTACIDNTSPSCPTGQTPNDAYGHGRINTYAAYTMSLSQH